MKAFSKASLAAVIILNAVPGKAEAAQKCGANSLRMEQFCTSPKGEVGNYSVDVECYDGLKLTITKKSCDSQAVMIDLAQSACKNHCSAPEPQLQPLCGLYKNGAGMTLFASLVATPFPPSTVANTDFACMQFCDSKRPLPGWFCMRGAVLLKKY